MNEVDAERNHVGDRDKVRRYTIVRLAHVLSLTRTGPPPVRVLRRQFPAKHVPTKWQETTRTALTQSFS